MSVSRETIDRLLQMCESPRRKGEWRAFCEREGLHRQTVYYWRYKLQLARRAYRKPKCTNLVVTI